MNNNKLFWKLLKDEYEPAMMFCRKLISDRDKGDDLFQDALVIACTRFDTLRDHNSFKPWLYRIIVNCFKMTVRRPWWKRRIPFSKEIESSLLTKDLTDHYTAKRWLNRASEILTAEEQTMLTLYEMEQWTVAELAEVYERSESFVKVRLHRIRKKMKKQLEQWLEISEENSLNKGGAPCAVANQKTE